MGEEKEVAEAKYKCTEQEGDQLKKELKDLRPTSEVQKKQLEELLAGFIVENESLTKDYQKQVDEMFFFEYQCYMRKNDIAQDISTYHSDDDEEAIMSGPTQGDKNSDALGLSTRQ